MVGMYTPVYMPPVHPWVHQPGYPAQRTRHDVQTGVYGLTALTRRVAEVTVGDEPLTVRHPFHCWSFPSDTRFTVEFVPRTIGFLPKNEGREEQLCAEWTPPSY